MGSHESERIDGKKTEVRTEQKEESKKRGENSFLVLFNRFIYVCVCMHVSVWVRVFGTVIFKPSLFYEPFFIRQHTFIIFLGISIWLFLLSFIYFILFICRGLIEVEYTHTHTHLLKHKLFKLLDRFSFLFFSFLLLFKKKHMKKKKKLCMFAFEIIHDQCIR